MASSSGSHPNVERMVGAQELAEFVNRAWTQLTSTFEVDQNDLPTDPSVNRVCIKMNNPSLITLLNNVAKEGGQLRPIKKLMQLIISHLSTVTDDDSIAITDIFNPLDVLAIAESVHGSCNLMNDRDVRRRIEEETPVVMSLQANKRLMYLMNAEQQHLIFDVHNDEQSRVIRRMAEIWNDKMLRILQVNDLGPGGPSASSKGPAKDSPSADDSGTGGPSVSSKGPAKDAPTATSSEANPKGSAEEIKETGSSDDSKPVLPNEIEIPKGTSSKGPEPMELDEEESEDGKRLTRAFDLLGQGHKDEPPPTIHEGTSTEEILTLPLPKETVHLWAKLNQRYSDEKGEKMGHLILKDWTINDVERIYMMIGISTDIEVFNKRIDSEMPNLSASYNTPELRKRYEDRTGTKIKATVMTAIRFANDMKKENDICKMPYQYFVFLAHYRLTQFFQRGGLSDPLKNLPEAGKMLTNYERFILLIPAHVKCRMYYLSILAVAQMQKGFHSMDNPGVIERPGVNFLKNHWTLKFEKVNQLRKLAPSIANPERPRMIHTHEGTEDRLQVVVLNLQSYGARVLMDDKQCHLIYVPHPQDAIDFPDASNNYMHQIVRPFDLISGVQVVAPQDVGLQNGFQVVFMYGPISLYKMEAANHFDLRTSDEYIQQQMYLDGDKRKKDVDFNIWKSARSEHSKGNTIIAHFNYQDGFSGLIDFQKDRKVNLVDFQGRFKDKMKVGWDKNRPRNDPLPGWLLDIDKDPRVEMRANMEQQENQEKEVVRTSVNEVLKAMEESKQEEGREDTSYLQSHCNAPLLRDSHASSSAREQWLANSASSKGQVECDDPITARNNAIQSVLRNAEENAVISSAEVLAPAHQREQMTMPNPPLGHVKLWNDHMAYIIREASNVDTDECGALYVATSDKPFIITRATLFELLGNFGLTTGRIMSLNLLSVIPNYDPSELIPWRVRVSWFSDGIGGFKNYASCVNALQETALYHYESAHIHERTRWGTRSQTEFMDEDAKKSFMNKHAIYVRPGKKIIDMIEEALEHRQHMDAIGILTGLEECFDTSKQNEYIYNHDKAEDLMANAAGIAAYLKRNFHNCIVVIMADATLFECDPRLDRVVGHLQTEFGILGVPCHIATKHMESATWLHSNATMHCFERNEDEKQRLGRMLYAYQRIMCLLNTQNYKEEARENSLHNIVGNWCGLSNSLLRQYMVNIPVTEKVTPEVHDDDSPWELPKEEEPYYLYPEQDRSREPGPSDSKGLDGDGTIADELDADSPHPDSIPVPNMSLARARQIRLIKEADIDAKIQFRDNVVDEIAPGSIVEARYSLAPPSDIDSSTHKPRTMNNVVNCYIYRDKKPAPGADAATWELYNKLVREIEDAKRHERISQVSEHAGPIWDSETRMIGSKGLVTREDETPLGIHDVFEPEGEAQMSEIICSTVDAETIQKWALYTNTDVDQANWEMDTHLAAALIIVNILGKGDNVISNEAGELVQEHPDPEWRFEEYSDSDGNSYDESSTLLEVLLYRDYAQAFAVFEQTPIPLVTSPYQLVRWNPCLYDVELAMTGRPQGEEDATLAHSLIAAGKMIWKFCYYYTHFSLTENYGCSTKELPKILNNFLDLVGSWEFDSKTIPTPRHERMTKDPLAPYFPPSAKDLKNMMTKIDNIINGHDEDGEQENDEWQGEVFGFGEPVFPMHLRRGLGERSDSGPEDEDMLSDASLESEGAMTDVAVLNAREFTPLVNVKLPSAKAKAKAKGTAGTIAGAPKRPPTPPIPSGSYTSAPEEWPKVRTNPTSQNTGNQRPKAPFKSPPPKLDASTTEMFSALGLQQTGTSWISPGSSKGQPSGSSSLNATPKRPPVPGRFNAKATPKGACDTKMGLPVMSGPSIQIRRAPSSLPRPADQGANDEEEDANPTQLRAARREWRKKALDRRMKVNNEIAQINSELMNTLLGDPSLWCDIAKYHWSMGRKAMPRPDHQFEPMWASRAFTVEAQTDWGIRRRGHDYDITLSRSLIKVLRHTTESDRLPIDFDKNGFCYIEEIVSYYTGLQDGTHSSRLKLDTRMVLGSVHPLRIYDLVASDSKRRFLLLRFDGDKYPSKIRATQAHSSDMVDLDEDDVVLHNVTRDEQRNVYKFHQCLHGTKRGCISGIQAEGLKPGGGRIGGRQFIFFSPFQYGDWRTVSGTRAGDEVSTYWSYTRMYSAGIEFSLTLSYALVTRQNVGPGNLQLALYNDTGLIIYCDSITTIANQGLLSEQGINRAMSAIVNNGSDIVTREPDPEDGDGPEGSSSRGPDPAREVIPTPDAASIPVPWRRRAEVSRSGVPLPDRPPSWTLGSRGNSTRVAQCLNEDDEPTSAGATSSRGRVVTMEEFNGPETAQVEQEDVAMTDAQTQQNIQLNNLQGVKCKHCGIDTLAVAPACIGCGRSDFRLEGTAKICNFAISAKMVEGLFVMMGKSTNDLMDTEYIAREGDEAISAPTDNTAAPEQAADEEDTSVVKKPKKKKKKPDNEDRKAKVKDLKITKKLIKSGFVSQKQRLELDSNFWLHKTPEERERILQSIEEEIEQPDADFPTAQAYIEMLQQAKHVEPETRNTSTASSSGSFGQGLMLKLRGAIMAITAGTASSAKVGPTEDIARKGIVDVLDSFVPMLTYIGLIAMLVFFTFLGIKIGVWWEKNRTVGMDHGGEPSRYNKLATMRNKNKSRSGPDRGEIWRMINKPFTKRVREENTNQAVPVQEADDNVSVNSWSVVGEDSTIRQRIVHGNGPRSSMDRYPQEVEKRDQGVQTRINRELMDTYGLGNRKFQMDFNVMPTEEPLEPWTVIVKPNFDGTTVFHKDTRCQALQRTDVIKMRKQVEVRACKICYGNSEKQVKSFVPTQHPATIPLPVRTVTCNRVGCRQLCNNLDHGWYLCPLCYSRFCSLTCVRHHLTHAKQDSCSMDIPWIADTDSLIQVHHQDTTIAVNPGRMVHSSKRLFPVDGQSEIPKFQQRMWTPKDKDNSHVHSDTMEELSRQQLMSLEDKRPSHHPARSKY